jgi:predicted O-linked N-acetylglucosamine transferase (SPINDLY family)
VKDSLCAYAFTRDRLFRALAEKGISGDRIDLMESTPSWYDHMSVYNEVDIALDALPQSSSTTAFDAIYMGTPLVAFRGAWIGARMSSSIVKSLGYPQWVAQTTDDYAKIVTALASNKEQLGVYKETLRAEMLSSALCDGKSLAAALETAFEHMIQSRYAGREIAERCETTN